ncbi:HCP-like protein [Fistulina hepatica ATCC 64428]|uniref:HCP-like protein n=1 Tax=Fistulina hepatica ATCC 64428 TaxID=1128425 RepID=A0A0D7AFU5_9AGAR|nr:HCP-like protein [Fistulina hepatica ATCC 64428]
MNDDMAAPPTLTAPLPTPRDLSSSLADVQGSMSESEKIAWCSQVLYLVDRAQPGYTSTDPLIGPAIIEDPQLKKLADLAVSIVLGISGSYPSGAGMPAFAAEALYHRACFAASGAFPTVVKQNPRQAFRDFEASARAGFSRAWFRLGRDYESFNDDDRARDCYERGTRGGDEASIYRLSMAHLLGQLDLPSSTATALPLLIRAANMSSLIAPQPAYVLALLMLGEFGSGKIPPVPRDMFVSVLSSAGRPNVDVLEEGRRHLERAAFLHFAPAQYKLGHAYEFATPPFPFDPLLSVQYYSLASQQGEVEADMALSKWFLCGSDADGPGASAGHFEKDEGLALTFARKAAEKGLPSAEFAMGYYAEVGVGQPKDVQLARTWYEKVSKAQVHGNPDAVKRLNALAQPAAQALSRQEHDNLTETTLVRKRTQARQRADAVVRRPGTGARRAGSEVIENVRKSTIMAPVPSAPAEIPRVPTLSEIPISSSPPLQLSLERPSSDRQRPSFSNERPAISGSPPRWTNSSGPPPSASPRLMPSMTRFSLADPGGGSAPRLTSPSPASRPVSPGSRRPSRNNTQNSESGSATPSLPTPGPQTPAFGPAKKGPTTFAEMGFQGVKAEKDECLIM